MLLKSSDFVVHDLSADSVFEGCVDVKDDGGGDGEEGRDRGDGRESRENGACARDGRLETKHQRAYELELVLRKWFAIDPSREMRAFVRDGVLVGASSVPNLPCLLGFYLFVSINPSRTHHVLSHRNSTWSHQASRSATRITTSF